jgi:hypothetical protein
VAKTSLVEPDIDGGARLVEALDEAEIEVGAAFWFLIPELSAWRLFIASPIVDKRGRRAAYEGVQKVLRQLTSAGVEAPALDDISAVSPGNEIVGLLSSAVGTGPGISRIRFTSNTVNGVFIEDAVIYRLT